jgi:hypothetical protein
VHVVDVVKSPRAFDRLTFSERGNQRVLNVRRIWLLVALSVAGFGLLVFGILLLHPIYVNVCEAAQAGATEKCEPNNLLYIAFLETMHGMTHAEFWTALATIFIAAFTFTLKRSTDKLWETNKDQIRLAREDFLSTHRPEIRFKHVWLVSEFMHDTAHRRAGNVRQ